MFLIPDLRNVTRNGLEVGRLCVGILEFTLRVGTFILAYLFAIQEEMPMDRLDSFGHSI